MQRVSANVGVKPSLTTSSSTSPSSLSQKSSSGVRIFQFLAKKTRWWPVDELRIYALDTLFQKFLFPASKWTLRTGQALDINVMLSDHLIIVAGMMLQKPSKDCYFGKRKNPLHCTRSMQWSMKCKIQCELWTGPWRHPRTRRHSHWLRQARSDEQPFPLRSLRSQYLYSQSALKNT